MNCVPGDLAVIVRTDRIELIGCLLQCIEICPGASYVMQLETWHFEPLSHALASTGLVHIADVCLRPLRGQAGADETLTWARVPRAKAKVSPR